MLDLVCDIDEEVSAKTLVQSRGDEVVEGDKSLLEVLCLHVGKTLKHQLEDCDEIRLEGLRWQISDNGFDEFEGVALMRLGGDKLLENAKYGFHLLVGDNTLGIARDHGA